jgi:protein O-GlcNAc transferase
MTDVPPMNRQQRRAAKRARARPQASGAPPGAPSQGRVRSLLEAGIAFHRSGRLAEAENCYRQVLSLEPDHGDANNLMGALATQAGRPDLAVDFIERAIRQNERSPVYLTNLGTALKRLGKPDEALDAYRRAIRFAPQDADAHYNLGTALFDLGRLDEAVAASRAAIKARPDFVQAHYNLGIALNAQGRYEEAVAAWRDVVRIRPDFAEAWNNIGTALRSLGNFDEAVAACRNAVSIKPGYSKAHCNLGIAHAGRGENDAAVLAYKEALRIDPGDAEIHYNLGLAYFQQGRHDESVSAYRRAIRIRPDYADACCNMGTALMGQGKHDAAARAFRQAIALRPDYAFAGSNLLMGMNYDPRLTPGQVFDAHCDWAARYTDPLTPVTDHANDRDAGRRLKVGYVSSDFRRHPVASFIEPLLRSHDRAQVEVFCYADVQRPDAVTERLAGLADRWLKTDQMPDVALAERIRLDGIDILVDLNGHTAGNRLMVFARKPAPVEVTWLGYPNTTGLRAIDYRLVDAITDPEGEADARASEALMRLPDGFLCFGAPPDVAAPAPPPCLTTGAVTFGSFNNPAKLSDAALEAWAALMRRLPDARLLLKGQPFADPAVCAWLLSRLGQRGIAAERIELASWIADGGSHLRLYDRIDIALDPFPYNGTTTTCEALWMGVPVVALAGDRHSGRVGASLLTQTGLTELIAGSVDDYVAVAARLAADPARLAELRNTLRPRLAASPLCDAAAFARKIEGAYRTMWRRWCET